MSAAEKYSMLSEDEEHFQSPMISEENFEDMFNIGNVLGKGRHAIVFRCTNKAGEEMAVKKIEKATLTAHQDAALKKEITVMSQLRHPNIVQLLETYQTPTHYFLVMELMAGGKLSARLEAQNRPSEVEVRNLIKNVLVAVAYCHRNGVVGLNLEPRKLLLSSVAGSPTVKILGTLNCDATMDTRNLGVLAHTLLCGYAPFNDETEAECIECEGPQWDRVSGQAVQWVRGMLAPEAPLSIQQALDHPWMHGDQVLTVRALDSEPNDYFQSNAKALPRTPDNGHQCRCTLYVIIGTAIAVIAAIVVVVVWMNTGQKCSESQYVRCPEPQAASEPYSQFLWNENCPDYVAGTRVYLGNGCFWERQYAYSNLEQDKFKRDMVNVTSVSGYAGSVCTGRGGLVCYHGALGSDYGALGHAEVVQVQLDPSKELEQFSELVTNFFHSFHYDSARKGMARPDDFSRYSGDHGSPYRSVIGLPGGTDSDLYPIVKDVNNAQQYPMIIEQGNGADPDKFNTVYVMDSCAFPFHRAEQYHQFHSNFFGPGYGSRYLVEMYNTMKANHRIDPTGCPEGFHQ